eukprot:m51a1_g10715 hypothetical protein (1221) ;mRNA; r:207202-214506
MAEQSTAPTTIALLAKDCPVSSVTVFNDRAEVVRTVSVDAQQPGTYEVRLQGLTQRVDRSSVHVSGGQGHAVILEVSCSDESVLDTAAAASAAQQHTARAAQLSEELRAAEQQRATLEVQLYVAHEAQAFTVGLAENVRATPRVEAQDQAFLGADYLERVKDFTDFYTAQLDTFCSRSSELTRRMAELADRVAVLKREIEASRHLAAAPAQRLTSRSVWVAFTATAAGRVALQVAYVVAGASWRAAYDCRVESATARAQLTYYGVITNSSGDCWDDTSVFLSTATPSVGGQLPRLPTCTASIFVPPTRVSESVTSATFEVPRRATIGSDGREHKVTIAVVALELALSYAVAPRVSEWAYLKATTRNTGACPLLASERCSVFVDGNFLATSAIGNTSVGEEFAVFLGTDKAVKVDYKAPTSVKDESGMLIKSHLDRYSGTIGVKNTKQQEIAVVVYEQLPKPSSAEIKVTALEPDLRGANSNTSPEGVAATLNGSNNIQWRVRLAPSQEVVLPIKYTVEYPRDKILAVVPDAGTGKGELVVGQSAGLTGPFARAGLALNAGLAAAFASANEASAVQFVLAALDDANNKDNMTDNVLKLICDGGASHGPAFAIAGTVGSVFSESVLMVLGMGEGPDGAPVPYMGGLTGSSTLRAREFAISGRSPEGPRAGVALTRAGVGDEVNAIVSFLGRDWDVLNRTAIVYQQDELAGFEMAILVNTSLQMMGATLLSAAVFPEAAGSSEGQLREMARKATDQLLAHGSPRAVILTTFGDVTGLILEEMASRGVSGVRYCGTTWYLAEDLFSAVPRKYRQAMDKYHPELQYSHTSFEGFISGRLIVMAATRALELHGWPLTRANFLDAIFRQARWFDVYDYRLGPYGDGIGSRYGMQTADDWCNQGAHEVFMTRMSLATGRLTEETSSSFKFEGCSSWNWGTVSARTVVGKAAADGILTLTSLASGISTAMPKLTARQVLRQPFKRYDGLLIFLGAHSPASSVVNLFASYYQEAKAAATILVHMHNSSSIRIVCNQTSHGAACQDFLDAARWFLRPGNQATFEGFLIGKFLTTVVSSVEDIPMYQITPEILLRTIYSKKYFHIDSKVSFGPFLDQNSGERECNQGMDTVYMTRWTGAAFSVEKFSVLEEGKFRCGSEFDAEEAQVHSSNALILGLSIGVPGAGLSALLLFGALIILRTRTRSTLKRMKRNDIEIGEVIGKVRTKTVGRAS